MRSLVAVAALAACRSAGVVDGDVVDGGVDGLGEASGVARRGGEFVYVDDERGVFVVKNGKPEKVAALDDLEGVCVVGDDVVVIAEGSGVVSAVGKDNKVRVLGTLPHPPSKKAKKNKGWEGIAFLPAKLAADGKDHLVAVHEGLPKAVGVFAWPSLAPEHTLELPADIDALVDDLSDVAVDPKTGGLLLLSDESRRLVRATLTLSPPSLALSSSTELPVKKDEKPEGVVVDDDGRVWVVTDGSGRLFALTR